MDTQLVAEKILTFCKTKYPDLKWIFHGFNYDQYHQTIQGLTDLTDSPEMEILLFIGDSGSVNEYSEGWEGIKGRCALNSGSSVCLMQWTGVIRNGTLIEKNIGRFLSIVFYLERTNQLNPLPDKDLVDLCPLSNHNK